MGLIDKIQAGGQFVFKKIFWITLLFIAILCLRQTLHKNALDPANPGYLVKMDAIEYYGYLPAFFIYQDPGFTFLNHPLPEKHISNFWVKPQPKNRFVTRMTLGYAIMASPGFLAGHAIAKITGRVADGFTTPYLAAVWTWTLFLVILALIVLRKMLLHMGLNDRVISITCIILVLGTNLFNYLTYEAFMTHAVNFFLCSLVVTCSYFWYVKNYFRYMAGAVLALTMIALIRPTDIILILVPVFIGIKSSRDFKNRIKIWTENWLQIYLAIILAVLIVCVQLLYWKWATGHYFYYGYEGESFFFSHWLLPEYLYSYRKGWFLYTPFMIFAVGALLLKPVRNNYALLIFGVIFISAWIHSCWWCWWFGGGFGARSMIDFYPLMSVPIAFLIHRVFSLRQIWKLVSAGVICFLLILNLKQTAQYQGGLLHWDAMTKKAYWSIFMKDNPPPDFDKMLSPTNAEEAKKGVIYR